MQSSARWSLLAVISLLLVTQTLANDEEIDRLLGARVERNCFFSPMGCMFLPGKKLSRVRRLPIRAERELFRLPVGAEREIKRLPPYWIF